MNTIRLLQILQRYPLFTENDVAKILKTTPTYVRTRLYRLHAQHYIYRIEKGKYSCHEDPLMYATYIATPSYFSLCTALRYHNLTPQQPVNLSVMTAVPRKKIVLGNTTIFFVKSKHVFGYTKQRYNDIDIFMAEPEKAIVDCLLYKVPLNYVREALDEENINYVKLAEYAQRTKNISLIKRLGYLMEQKTGNDFGL